MLHSDHIALQVFQSLDLSNVRGRASNTWYRMVTLPCTFFLFQIKRENLFKENYDQIKALIGCSRIRINPYMLEWSKVEVELNSVPIYLNTYGLR